MAEDLPAGVQTLHQEHRGGQREGAGNSLRTGQQVRFGEELTLLNTRLYTNQQILQMSPHLISDHFFCLFHFQGFSLFLGLLGSHSGEILLHRF